MPFMRKAGKQGIFLYSCFPHKKTGWHDVQGAFAKYKMREKGIQTSIHYPPIHKFPDFRDEYADVSLLNTENAASREVTLPLYSTMTREQVDLVIESVLTSL